MKKKIFNTIFMMFLVFLYFGRNYFYNFYSEEFLNTNLVETYESVNSEEFSYTSGLFNYELSAVLYRDIYDFYDEITIFKGENDGLIEGNAVVDETALIGVISKTESDSSKVTLLTNKKINLSVKVGDSFGILKYIDDRLVITNLTSEDFAVGNYVYTSGYSKLYEGILIGVVTNKNEETLEKSYYVNLLGDFNEMNYLVVVKDLK